MVISGRAKAVIGALVSFFLLGVVLVTGSTKGWFNANDFGGERAAAQIQVNANAVYLSVNYPVESPWVLRGLKFMLSVMQRLSLAKFAESGSSKPTYPRNRWVHRKLLLSKDYR